MLRLLAMLAAIAAAAALLPACGGEGEQQSSDAGELLARAFDTPVETGRMSLTAEVQVDGVPGLGDGLELRVSGPFTKRAADLDVTVGGLGPALSGGLTITERNIWVSFAGQAYELGEETVAELTGEVEERTGRDAGAITLESLGVNVEDWLRDPRVDGRAEVEGEPVTKVVAELDAAAALADLQGLSEKGGAGSDGEDLEELAGLLEDGTLEVYVSEDDQTVRRLAFDIEFEIPEDRRSQLGGAEGGAATIDVTFTEVGEPQRIEPPSGARPLGDLLRQFGLGPELLLQ